MAGLIRFVKAPAAAPVTVLDINQPETGMYVRGDEFSLGAPQWDAEPGAVDVDDGYREASMTVAVDFSYTDAAEHVSALSRVLQNNVGWLMVQRDTTHEPMFLRWYRSTPQPLNWELWEIDTYTLQVTLDCDAYLYGEPITIGPYNVTNNPNAAVTHKASVLLPDIVGDAPTPLKVSVTPDNQWTFFTSLLSSTAYPSDQVWGGPIVWPFKAAQFTAGTDTGADVTSGAFIAGSYREVTFATNANMVARLTGGPATPPIPGRYKVLMRTTANGTGESDFMLRIDHLSSTSGQTIRTGDDQRFLANGTHRAYIDMGEYTFPFGVTGLDESDIVVTGEPEIAVFAERLSGTLTLRLDAIVLIPVATALTLDARIMLTAFRDIGEPGGAFDKTAEWDGQRLRYVTYLSGALGEYLAPRIDGGWLRATPGAVNFVHLLHQTNGIDEGATLPDSNTALADIVISYMPRYLHLAPDGG